MIKNKISIIASFTFATIVALSSCGSIESERYPWLYYNDDKESSEIGRGGGATDPSAMAKELHDAMGLILSPQEHKYQYQRANTIDVYAGYWTVSQNKFLFGGALPTTYYYPNDYLGGPYAIGGFPGLKNAYFHGDELNRSYLKAIAMILYSYSMQEITDIYGPVPFDDLRAGKNFPPLKYESQRDIYYKIFNELDMAIEILNKEKPTALQLAEAEGEKGGVSRGDWRNWVKFANSLRLRMALNMVKVEPDDAREQAEKAVSDPIGVFTDADAYDFTQDREHCDWFSNNPLWFISSGWDDLRLGGSLENILKRYENPLLGVWFTKCGTISDASGNPTGIVSGDDYYGIRQGSSMINKTDKTKGYGPFSYAGAGIQNMGIPFLKRTEMLFGMAEGALRGWSMGGTAEDFYRRGVILSFTENGLSRSQAEEYLEKTKVKDIDFVDPYNNSNNIKGRVNVGVKWNESDTDEVKLEKIITQRWIAIFPSSAEAWTTFRRTGYPRLFPPTLNQWPGVDSEIQLRRIPYVENPNNSADLAQLPSLMDGQPNTGASRLWWDKDTNKYGEKGVNNSPVVIPSNF